MIFFRKKRLLHRLTLVIFCTTATHILFANPAAITFCQHHANSCSYQQSRDEVTIQLGPDSRKLSELLTDLHKNVPTLTALNLSRNNLTEIPATIGNLTALTRLDLSHNIKLTEIPATIGNLTALTELYIENNNLTALPAEIGNLTALNCLNLSDNKLTSLPTEIGNLTALNCLHLSNNPLAALPLSNHMVNRSHALAFVTPRTPQAYAEVARQRVFPIQFEAEEITETPRGGALAVVGQEALTAQRGVVIHNWQTFVAHNEDLTHRYLPHSPSVAATEFAAFFPEMKVYLTRKQDQYTEEKRHLFLSLDTPEHRSALSTFPRIKEEDKVRFFATHPTFLHFNALHIERQAHFRFHTALRGLKLLVGDVTMPHHRVSSREAYRTWHYQDMPESLQLFVFAYKLALRPMPEALSQELVKTWLAETYNSADKMKTFHEKFPRLNQADIGQVLASQDGQDFVAFLASHLQEQEPTVKSRVILTNPGAMKAAIHIVNGIQKDQRDQAFTPLVEALMMTMRGHNSHLDLVEEPDRPACADGSYLHMLNAVSEIARHQGFRGAAGVELHDCE
jgi:hypothetical protein